MNARLGIPLLFIAMLAGCSRPRPDAETPQPPVGYPGTLAHPSSLAHNFMVRQHATGRYDERAISFDAVVQKTGDKLLVLLLTPYGSRALLVEQTGTDVRTEKFVQRELPFDPEFILLDVQRVFLKGIPRTDAAPDGWSEATVNEEVVRERWQAGRLFERQYRRVDDAPPGLISVGYEGGYEPGQHPPAITFENGWFGYSLRFETSEFHPL